MLVFVRVPLGDFKLTVLIESHPLKPHIVNYLAALLYLLLFNDLFALIYRLRDALKALLLNGYFIIFVVETVLGGSRTTTRIGWYIPGRIIFGCMVLRVVGDVILASVGSTPQAVLDSFLHLPTLAVIVFTHLLRVVDLPLLIHLVRSLRHPKRPLVLIPHLVSAIFLILMLVLVNEELGRLVSAFAILPGIILGNNLLFNGSSL